MKQNHANSPLQTKARDREPTFAIVSRLAATGGVSAVDFGQDIGVPLARVLRGDAKTLDEIAAITGIESSALGRWTPLPEGKTKREINGHLFPVRPTLTSEVRGCPSCLQDDVQQSALSAHRAMTFRSHWLVHHVTLCIRHKRPLETLWKEAAPSLRYDTAAQFANIADRIIADDAPFERRDPTPFEIWFDQRLSGQPHETTWLDDHPLHAAAVFCRLLGIALLKLHDLRLSDLRPGSEWACYHLGFETARHGEEAILKELRRLNQLAEPRLGPKAVFPVLYDRLSREHVEDTDFAVYREVLARHLMESWPLGPGDDLLGTPVTERKLHSVRTAANETGIDIRRLRKMLEAANMIDAGLPDNWAVFDAKNAKTMMDSLLTFVSAKQFYEMHHIGRSQFNLLVEDGIVQPSLQDATTKYIWDPRKGRDLVYRLLVGGEIIQQAQHGWETIGKATQRLQLRPGEIIKAIWDGRIQLVARNVQFEGYASIHVYHDEVAQVLAKEQPSAMSLEMFAKTVGIANPVYLNRLVQHGYVSTSEMRNPRTKILQRYIATKDASTFHEQFITLRILARTKGQTWQSLARQLRNAGVSTFNIDGIDFGPVYLKTEVEAALAD
ncbi:hypothetical protein BVC71_01935 [Marivivens niveibacter]|uniref:TniQ domain-containing protein n=1 Tax=Marivivens niveibacter TaxID=1930667 RepID=A0A251X135_9RHOB|nr:TniQ family protein [Marivivens niveibacter]OUD10296.1 hypothetical protein BVC71_01935 [Marivivens niveibacter]